MSMDIFQQFREQFMTAGHNPGCEYYYYTEEYYQNYDMIQKLCDIFKFHELIGVERSKFGLSCYIKLRKLFQRVVQHTKEGSECTEIISITCSYFHSELNYQLIINNLLYRPGHFNEILHHWVCKELFFRLIKLLAKQVSTKGFLLQSDSISLSSYYNAFDNDIIKRSTSDRDSLDCEEKVFIEKIESKIFKKEPEEKVAKVPKRGTLKYKRYNMKKLKPDENYEDDIFEERPEKKLRKLKRLRILEDFSSNDLYETETPTLPFSISPRTRSVSPSYEDCYSPTELSNCRKEAEEYQYQRSKRRKCKKTRSCNKEKNCSSGKMNKKLDTDRTLQLVSEALKGLKKPESDDEDKDYYFGDEEDSEGEN